MLGVPEIGRPNLYAAIAAMADEIGQLKDTDQPDLMPWFNAMHTLEERGSVDRFEFLRDIFLGSRPPFADPVDVWSLAKSDPRYPSYDIVPGSTARAAQPSGDPATSALVRLGNLQYTTVLALLDLYFRQHLPVYRSLAVSHMMGPLRAIGKHLPRLGVGLPFAAIGVPRLFRPHTETPAGFRSGPRARNPKSGRVPGCSITARLSTRTHRRNSGETSGYNAA